MTTEWLLDDVYTLSLAKLLGWFNEKLINENLETF